MPGIMGSAMFLMPNSSNGMTAKDVMFNRPTVYQKLRRQIAASSEYDQMLEAIGDLDTLLGLTKFKHSVETNGHRTVMPKIETSDHLFFEAINMKNPLLALDAGRVVVGNTIAFGDNSSRLTFLTGPNSGGKS